MTVTTETDIDRKAVALEYLKRLDRGEDFFELFDDNAQFWFPKWGIADGIEAIRAAFGGIGSILQGITHDYAYFNYVVNGDVVVVEGTSAGVAADGTAFRAGVGHAGRWCDVFEIRGGKIHRLFIYLDPDYAGADTARYPWLASGAPA